MYIKVGLRRPAWYVLVYRQYVANKTKTGLSILNVDLGVNGVAV